MPANPFDTPDVLAINLCILLGIDPGMVYEDGIDIDWDLGKITVAHIATHPLNGEFVREYTVHPFPEGFKR